MCLLWACSQNCNWTLIYFCSPSFASHLLAFPSLQRAPSISQKWSYQMADITQFPFLPPFCSNTHAEEPLVLPRFQWDCFTVAIAKASRAISAVSVCSGWVFHPQDHRKVFACYSVEGILLNSEQVSILLSKYEALFMDRMAIYLHLSQTVFVYACCPGLIINTVHIQICCGLGTNYILTLSTDPTCISHPCIFWSPSFI